MEVRTQRGRTPASPGPARSTAVAVAVALAVSTALAASFAAPGTASAQETTTTVAPTTTPPTTVPSAPETTVVDPAAPADPAPTTTTEPSAADPGSTTSTTTSTTLPVDPLDPFGTSAEGLSSGAYGGQPPFDMTSRSVLTAQLAAARRALATAEERYAAAQTALAASASDLGRLAERLDGTGGDREDRIVAASEAKASMLRRVVAAYVRGDAAASVALTLGDPVEHSRATRYLEALAGQDREAIDEYRRSVADMDRDERRLVDDQTAARTRGDALRTEVATSLRLVLDARRCVDAWARGTRVCPPGFRFPVLGEVTFADTWGAPRMPGTANAHWHEGTDIMAPEGREIVATEDGVVSKVGSAGLGGLRLWLTGASGTTYYYAHFSRFAEGMVDGTQVTAGQVLGYVGSTGNAAGGPSHLHFEIHPDGGRPADPAPMLFAAWGRRPMAPQSTIMVRIPAVLGSLPPEER